MIALTSGNMKQLSLCSFDCRNETVSSWFHDSGKQQLMTIAPKCLECLHLRKYAKSLVKLSKSVLSGESLQKPDKDG